MPFRLIHRTNTTALYIDASDNDFEVPFPVVLAQGVWQGNGCCRGFGNRVVDVVEQDFEYTQLYLYFVSETRYNNNNNNHRFLKFVLRRDENIDWHLVAEPRPGQVTVGIERSFLQMPRTYGKVYHFHIGLEMD